MAKCIDMKGRSLLALETVSEAEIVYLLDLAASLKARKRAGIRGDLLKQKNIGLVFEKPSTRTRCAAVVAVVDEGGSAEYLDVHNIHLGKKESVVDTARALGRMLDGILFRGYRQATAELLARYAGIPVWNGLTDDCHPTQILADLLTVREAFKGSAPLKMVYIGDGRNNVATSLMVGCAKVGINFVNCTPAELAPSAKFVLESQRIASAKKTTVAVSHSPDTAVRGANVVYTDTWVSMGEEACFAERVKLLRPYQVNMKLMRRTGMLESGEVIFLHCLPAFHDANTDFTRECGALEVTDDVFESPFSRVFDQTENKMHTLKALMVATVGTVPCDLLKPETKGKRTWRKPKRSN
ncbi:MAG: ornithine carbamoyltransferase [bacterium]